LKALKNELNKNNLNQFKNNETVKGKNVVLKNLKDEDNEPLIISNKPTYLNNFLNGNVNNNLKVNNIKDEDNNNKERNYTDYQKMPMKSTLINIITTNKLTKKKYKNNTNLYLNPNDETKIIDNNSSIIEEKSNNERNNDSSLNYYKKQSNQILNENQYNEHTNNENENNENNFNLTNHSNIFIDKINSNDGGFYNETDEENTIYNNNLDSSNISNDEDNNKSNPKNENIIQNNTFKNHNNVKDENSSIISNTIQQIYDTYSE
jgi:hypothetical protein